MRGRLMWPLGVCLVTAVYACVPLLASQLFYMRGDTAAQFAPTWFHLGQLVRDGGWPAWLDPDSWAGGNYAAEALFGIYNPLNALIWLVVSGASDLVVAVTAVKAGILVLLALGTYLLATEYGAARWAAAVVAVALPFSGFTLYWDAGSWPSGLIAFAYAPWVWWSFRRLLTGKMNPFWAFLVGVLAVTQGNPYGTLAVVVIGLGVLVEGAVTGARRGILLVVAVGACVAAFLPLVYLPLLETSELAARSGGELFQNTGKLRPRLGDLLNLSAPTYVPDVKAITGPMRVPATYFAWFVLPLLPWLRYDVLRSRARELTGVGVIGMLYLLMALGPSKLWLFRWPLRLVEYFYLSFAIVLAVVLGAGLHRDRWRLRLTLTGAIVAFTSVLTWSQDPTWTAAALGGPVLLLLATAGLLGVHRWGPRTPAVLAAALMLGTGVTLVGQMKVFGENASSRLWHLPGDVAALEQRFGGLEGRTMQFADLSPEQRKRQERKLRAAWDSFLPGSMYHVAGVEAVNNYTGMGYRPFERTLCLHYEGFTKACGYRNFWKPLVYGGPPLSDLMKVQTVVVQPRLTGDVEPPAGWSSDATADVLTLRREEPLPWPQSRLSYVSEGVEVEGARSEGPYRDSVTVTSAAGGRAVFAMLAWPGYTATLDGSPLPVEHNAAGLLRVPLPRDTSGTLVVSFQPPGLRLGLAAAGLGTLGAVGLAVLSLWRRRRDIRRTTPGGTTAPSA